MSRRISYEMLLALRAVRRGATLSAAARRYGVNLRALRRACRRSGVPPGGARRRKAE